MLTKRSWGSVNSLLSAVPSSDVFRISPHSFTVLVLRRLRLPLPPISRSCRCGRPLDSCGRHRAVQQSWRSWPKASRCSEGLSWPLTPLWCQRTIVTVPLDVVGQQMMVQRCLWRAAGRRPQETATFLRLLAAARTRGECTLLKKGVEVALGRNVGCSCIRWIPSRAAGQWWCRWRGPCTPWLVVITVISVSDSLFLH